MMILGSPKVPVLLNYGINEARFTKPVYPGMTCHPGLEPGQVRFTVKEKEGLLARDGEAR